VSALDRWLSRFQLSPRSQRVLVEAEASTRAVQPQLQDDGTHLLYTVMPADAVGDEGQVILQRFDGAERTVLLSGGTNAKILPSGHLIYIHNGAVFAMPYDATRRAVAGAPVAVVDGVSETSSSWAGQFSISDTGTLVYRPGVFSFSKRALLSTDRQGRELAVFGDMRDHAFPRVSPDGSKIVVTSNDGENDLWLWDLAKSTWTRLTFGAAADGFAVWMPDSRHVVFRSADAGRTDIVRRAVDGTGNAEPVSGTAIGLPGNRDFFVNALNWLSQQENLIAVRPRQPEDRRLAMTADAQNRIMILTLFIIPGLVFATGIYTWWKRR